MSVDDLVRDITINMSSDGSADYISLIENLGLIGRVTSLILGLFVTVIVIGVPIVVAVELAYINFPVLQIKVEKVVLKTTGKLNKALGLVIHDARLATEKANTVETGNNVNKIYLGLKCKAIFLAVLSAALVLGAGPYVIQLISKIAQSLIDGFRAVL